MKNQKPAGRVREWHVWTLFIIAFSGFVSGAYGVGPAISWVLEKLFS